MDPQKKKKKKEGERTLTKENWLTTSEWICYVGENVRRSVGELGQLSILGRYSEFRSGQENSNIIKKGRPSSQKLTYVQQGQET